MAVAIIATIFWLIRTSQHGFDQLNLIAIFLVVMAWAMYLVRKGMRRRMENFEAEMTSGKKKKPSKKVEK